MSDVSRSAYQKVVEENKKLKEDIRILVAKPGLGSASKVICQAKWRDHFATEKSFIEMMKVVAKDNLKKREEGNG